GSSQGFRQGQALADPQCESGDHGVSASHSIYRVDLRNHRPENALVAYGKGAIRSQGYRDDLHAFLMYGPGRFDDLVKIVTGFSGEHPDLVDIGFDHGR